MAASFYLRALSFALIWAAFVLQQGCFWVTTKHEGNQLRTEMDDLSSRVAKNEETLGEKITKLQATLDEAQTFLSQNSANIGADVDRLARESAELNGLVQEAKRIVDDIRRQLDEQNLRIAELENKPLSSAGSRGTSNASPLSADDLYSRGLAALNQSNFADARPYFQNLVARYPSHERADDAQYSLGVSYTQEGNHRRAISEYQAVFENFAKSPLAADALFQAGSGAESLKWCTDARAYYALLQKKYPRSSFSRKAKSQDQKLRKNSKNKRVCQS